MRLRIFFRNKSALVSILELRKSFNVIVGRFSIVFKYHLQLKMTTLFIFNKFINNSKLFEVLQLPHQEINEFRKISNVVKFYYYDVK